MSLGFSNLLKSSPITAPKPGPLTGGALPTGSPSLFSSMGGGSAPKITSLTGNGQASTAGSFGGLFNPQPLNTGGLLGSMVPSTPVKSTTVNHPDGTSVATTYHPPVTQTTQTSATQNTPTPSNTADTSGILNKLTGLQGDLARAQAAGYNGNDQIAYDDKGNPIPKPTSATTPPAQSGLLNELLQAANNGQSKIDIANQNLQQLKSDVADKNAGIIGSGADLNFKTGEEGALQSLAATKEAAAQTAVSNALAGNQQNIGALESAIGSTAPVTQFGQLTNPQTGAVVGGTNGVNPQLKSAVDREVAAVKAKTETQEQALANLSGYGQAGTNALRDALSGYNPTTGTADVSSIANQQGQLNEFTNSYQQAQGLQNQLKTLIANSGVNPDPVAFSNNLRQIFAGQVGDPKYQNLSNLVTDLVTTYAPILGATGNVTNDKLALSQSLINSLASGSDIVSVLSGLDQQAQAKIKGIQTNIQNLQSNNTGTAGISSPGTSGSDSATIGGTTFKLVNGQWTVSK